MKPIEVVAAVIRHEGRILCTQRKPGKYEYMSWKYEFPGGKVEPGESRAEALKREIREELELEIDVLDEEPCCSVEHAYPDFVIRMHAFRCEARSMDFRLNDHAAACLLPAEALMTLDWAPADVPIVRMLMAEARGQENDS